MSLIGTLLTLIICLALLVTLVTHLLFFYETRSSGGYASWLSRLDCGPGRALLRSVLQGWGSQTLVAILYPLGLIRGVFFPRPSRMPEDSAPPLIIMLVHGLYHNPTGWLHFRHRLLRTGHRHVCAYGYSSWKEDFHELAEGLRQAILAAAACHPRARVVLVGHSLGGLLSRYCASMEDVRDRLAGVVTLGTPHQGSKLASLGIGRLALSLEYEGAVVQAVKQHEQPIRCPALSLFSPTDNFVFPEDALRIQAKGWVEEQTPIMSHVAMLFHPAVFARILAFLRNLH